MSRRNLAAPRSPIGSIIIPFYLHQGRGWLWGNNSRPKKRYSLPFNRLPPSTGREASVVFHSDSISGFGPDIYSSLSPDNRWMRLYHRSFHPIYTNFASVFPSFQFVSITRVHHFFVFLPCHLLPSRLVSSRLVSSRQTSNIVFHIFARRITIDKSHARDSRLFVTISGERTDP